MTSGITTERALASTAQWTAAIRAAEQTRDDRLVDDPWAMALAGGEGQDWLEGKASDFGAAAIAIRSRYFDDFVRCCVAGPEVRQAVLVASGLDTRAFRLPWPSDSRVFDLDQAVVLDRKASVLGDAGVTPACDYTAVAADLRGPWPTALGEAGFDPSAPTCWLLEGLLFYLPEDTVTQLLDDVSELSAAGSSLGFDAASRATLTHPATRAWIDMQASRGAPWVSGLDDPEAFLADRGWDAEVAQIGEDGANYGRWPYPVPPRALPDAPRLWLVTARRA
jgi:methyltransferase (TIGR00027 family)